MWKKNITEIKYKKNPYALRRSECEWCAAACPTSHDMNRFIPHVHRARPLNGFENGPNLAENRIELVLLQPDMEIPSFSQRTGLGLVSKSYS